MGKIDDMRRQREAQYAKAGPSKAADTKTATATTDEHGKCPECGKTKPMNNGLLANHQKGFGKACAGSRKKPV